MKKSVTRTLSIEEWCALAAAPGAPLPPVWIHVVSGSMQPLIRPFRDQALLVSVSGEELKPGDIVLFPAKCISGNYCLHRLYKVDGDRVRTFGDFCTRPDGWFPKKRILGKVLTIRRGRRVIDCDSRFHLFLARAWMRFGMFRPLFLLPYRVCAKLVRGAKKQCEVIYHGNHGSPPSRDTENSTNETFGSRAEYPSISPRPKIQDGQKAAFRAKPRFHSRFRVA